MKLLLIGATGMIGSRVAAEAGARGHQVTGVTRSGADGTQAADLTDAKRIAELAAGHDAIVVAVSPPRDGSDPAGPVLAAGRALLDAARRSAVRRVVIVGGAGSLLMPDGSRLVDQPAFPDVVKPEAMSHVGLLQMLRDDAVDLDWTYVSPAALIGPGERTGKYTVGGDAFHTNAAGESKISAEDYAAALIDEVESGANLRRRISVVGA